MAEKSLKLSARGGLKEQKNLPILAPYQQPVQDFSQNFHLLNFRSSTTNKIGIRPRINKNAKIFSNGVLLGKNEHLNDDSSNPLSSILTPEINHNDYVP
jgi:hypothetical protein